MPQEPALTFTIPSINDGTVLDCRIFHPSTFEAIHESSASWRRHAAVLAHPYAAMGGNFDDPIVEMIMETLLKRGFVVATFNFRGAGHSAGRTSWTSKPEQDDFSSIIGFLTYYMVSLNPYRSDHEPAVQESTPLQTGKPPRLLIGGYSYGSIVTVVMPPLERILKDFETPLSESHAAHIRLRAESLAHQQNDVLETTRSALRQRHAPTSPTRRSIRVGGDDGSTTPRHSHDGSRRSFGFDEDLFKRGVHDLLSKHRKHRSTEPTHDEPAAGKLPRCSNMVVPKAAYLLISPLQGLASRLITMSMLPSAVSRSRDANVQAAEDKLVNSPTLAIYGDEDGFSQVGKLRTWVKRLSEQQESQFYGEEITGAGHFWAEQDVLPKMLHLVDAFAKNLDD